MSFPNFSFRSNDIKTHKTIYMYRVVGLFYGTNVKRSDLPEKLHSALRFAEIATQANYLTHGSYTRSINDWWSI